ncbi:hypothetical protein BC834DRAFT_910313 [Gloeopeniophorella convolvens]|nr:hypothetical protein BC834DRAFT_910313 [Gloeopeniophorella convolvens]
MDYLRTLGSAAVSSIVQKSGLNLPFSLGRRLPPLDGLALWTLYDATKRDDGSPVSVFEFNSQQRRSLLPVAQNALRKLRVTRHPDVVKFMDAVEADGTVYIVTERVRPLSAELLSWEGKPMKDRQDWLLWGLHRITNALSFINSSCNAAHGTVRSSSIFLSVSGEWKLGGFELFSNPSEPTAVLATYAGDMNVHRMPESERGGWAALKDGPIAATDSYALALLISTLFNPSDSHPTFLNPPYNPPQPSARGAIPPSVWPSFKKMLNPNPKGRMTPKAFLDVGMAESLGEGGGFFKENRLFKICEGLEGFGLMADGERSTLLRTIKEASPTLPATFATYLVLPTLLTSLSHSTMATSASSIIPLVIQLGTYVPPDEYRKLVLEPIVKLFANPDRGTRMALLDALPEFAEKLDKQTVSEKIWPNLQTGFADTVPLLRESTVKAIGLLTDKNTRRKVLGAACAKALKDNFPPARVAALMACMACASLFDMEELAGKVIGLVAGALVDKEKTVRDQAFKAVAMFVKILEENAATMPETTFTGDGPGTVGISTPNGSAQATLASSAAGAAGALAGWAISSIGKKFAPGDLQADIAAPAMHPPPVPGGTKPVSSNLQAAPAVPTGSKPKGMQLSSHKASVPGALPAELGGGVRWGGDLMDVSADADDWNDFESAPAGAANLGTSIVGLGFDGAGDDEDPWGAFEDPTPAPIPIPVTELTAAPIPVLAPGRPVTTQSSRPARVAALSPSPSPSPRASPLASPVVSQRAMSSAASVSPPSTTPTPSTAGMTKEEKAAEIARRKEERKQRIAQLKEQKKNAVVEKG